jgi:hypothetical protein
VATNQTEVSMTAERETWLDRTRASVARRSRDAVRRWRRRRVTRKKSRGKQVYALTASLLVLAALFVWALSYLAPKSPGRQITLNQLAALAARHQLVSAEFRDEDARIVGTFTCAVTSAPPRRKGRACR